MMMTGRFSTGRVIHDHAVMLFSGHVRESFGANRPHLIAFGMRQRTGGQGDCEHSNCREAEDVRVMICS
jgi:hypothetical protein